MTGRLSADCPEDHQGKAEGRFVCDFAILYPVKNKFLF